MVRSGVRLVGWGRNQSFRCHRDELGITLGKDKSGLFKEENHRFQRNGEPLNEDQRAACLRFYGDSYKAISAAAKQGQDVAISDVVDNVADIGGHEKTTMIYGLYSWSGAIRRRQSAIQHIGPDNVFLPSRYYLASMNAVLGMHAMGEA